jgi:hypothetical protein
MAGAYVCLSCEGDCTSSYATGLINEWIRHPHNDRVEILSRGLLILLVLKQGCGELCILALAIQIGVII